MSIAVIVAYSKDNVDKTTIGLTLAGAALQKGEPVSVILMSEGVRLAVKGYADDMDNGDPFKPVQILIQELFSGGAEVYVCTPCVKQRKIDEREIIPMVTAIGGADVIRILKSRDRTIQL